MRLGKRVQRALALSACVVAGLIATTGACLTETNPAIHTPTLHAGRYVLVSVVGLSLPANFTAPDGTRHRLFADTLEFNPSLTAYTERGTVANIATDGTIGPAGPFAIPATTFTQQSATNFNLPVTIAGPAPGFVTTDAEILLNFPAMGSWRYTLR